jgi:hypothetical protein
MKQAITALLLAGFAFLRPATATAQDADKWIISIDLKGASLEEAFKQIESLTKLRFNYKTDDVSGINNITYHQRNASVKKILTDLLSKTKLQFEQLQHYILIKSKKNQPAGNVTVYGFVTALQSGESLIGASISLSGAHAYSAVTNAYGFYSLTVPAGEYRIATSFIGYQDFERILNLKQTSRNNIEMAINEVYLEPLEVASAGRKSIVQKVVTGNHRLSMETVKKIAMAGGEPDVLKSLQFLPGIQAANEGTTNLSVRGGSFDQNLILLDEAPVYNPSHTFGFISAFNPDALKDMSIYKGVFPAQYGGRLSSVIDIRMKEGNNKERRISGGIGLLSSRLTYESPVKKEHSSVMLSARYSNIGMLMNLGKALTIVDARTSKNKVSYYDINAKYNVGLGRKDRLFLSAYTGHDNFFLAMIDKGTMTKWGNTTVSARWNHVFNPNLFSNTSILYSNYNYSYNNAESGQNFLWKANLKEVTAKTDFDWSMNRNNLVKFGTGIIGQQVLPGKTEPVKGDEITRAITLNQRRSFHFFAYLGNEQKVARGFHISYGVRATNFIAMGHGWHYRYNEDTTVVIDSTYYPRSKTLQSYFNLEPRFTARVVLLHSSSIKFSYGRNYQFQHLLTNSSAGLPTDMWLPSDTYIKPQYSDHFVTGVYKTFGLGYWEASVELYYRKSNRIIDFKDHAQLFLNDQVETQILTGRARSYGLELLLQRNKGKSKGWISYTWSKSMRQIDGINNDKWYPASYDRRHNLSVVFNRTLSKRLELSGNFVYRSGGNTTIPIGTYMFNGVRFLYYGERNGYRLPAYHRLDLSLTWQGKPGVKRKWRGEWVLSVYNAYNRQNLFALFVSQDPYNYSYTTATKVHLAGIIPAITYNFKF